MMRCALCKTLCVACQGALSTLQGTISTVSENKAYTYCPREQRSCIRAAVRHSGDLRRCGAEDFERERTFCAVCVTRLQRSWTSIDQHFQGVCTVYSLACGKGADRLSMGKHGHEWARGPGVTDAFLRSLVPECYDIIAESSVGNSNGTVSSSEGQSGPSSGSYAARRMLCAICVPDSSARWRWPALAHASVPN